VVLLGRLRRKSQAEESREEDLSWADLLELLRRNRTRQPGVPPGDVPEDASLEELLAKLPARARQALAIPPEELRWMDAGGVERRASRRRWGNPTEVRIFSALWPGYVHGLVINRSTGGLALLLDREVPADTAVKLRSVEAPGTVPGIKMQVRHCGKAGKNFLIGCEFSEDVPWNVRVWFG
jgi:hypothetical protein